MAATIVKTVTTVSKLAVGVGAVYVTIDQGVWGNNSQAVKALDKVRNSVLPAANDYIKAIPTVDEVNTSVLQTWNSGVMKTFTFIESVPSKIGRYGKKAYDSALNLVKEN